MGPVLAWKGPGQRTPRGHLSQSPCGPCDPAGWGGGRGCECVLLSWRLALPSLVEAAWRAPPGDSGDFQ